MGKNPANLKSSMHSALLFLPGLSSLRPVSSSPCCPCRISSRANTLNCQALTSGGHTFFFLFFYSFLPVSDWPLSLLTFLPFLPACPGQAPPEGEAEGGNQATHGSPLGEQCRFLLGSWSWRGRRESPCRCVQSCQPVARGKKGAVILSVSRSL